jgi:predicted nuclease of restriction endonuclease-like RecB superfamily
VLTADLIKVRRRGGKLQPTWLKGAALEDWMPVAQALVEIFEQCEGMTVARLDQAIEALVGDVSDRIRALGLVKLLRDRYEIDEASGAQAETTRALVFSHAALARRHLGLLESFDREALIVLCADQCSSTADKIEAALFSDLPGAQVIRRYKRISPTGLLQRYNLALAQGVLLRASRVHVKLAPAPAVRLREIFRMLKFCRLMHQVLGDATAGYELVIDGPMSLFESTQRYGLQLAMLLPTLVAGEGWSLNADVSWGKERQKFEFELSWRDGLVSTRDAAAEPEEVACLERTFERMESDWTVRREATVFDIRGKGVFVPDLIFEHKHSAERVYLEVFGYWSRQAVFKRLELLDGGFQHKVILAVSRKLRVSEEAAQPEFPGRIVVYTQSISASSVKQVLTEMSKA